MKPSKWLWAVVAAQALFLLGWAGYHEMVRSTAPVLRLKTRPADPRDLLRGDYMTLNYEISRHPAPAGWTAGQNATVYVVFKLTDGYGVIDEILLHEPPPGDPRLCAQAVADHRATWSDPFSSPAATKPAELRLTYGIEQFFVPEGKGTPHFQTLEADVSVSPTRRLYLRRVLVDGKNYP